MISKRNAVLNSANLKRLNPSRIHHPLREGWEHDLYPKVSTLLDSMQVKWNSVDPFHIGWEEWITFVPAILWIGVEPGSLSGDYGAVVASECHKLLVEHDITDVDVEICECIPY